MDFYHPQIANYRCAVIGNPIAHSKSPELHQAFARQTGVNLSYEKLLCPNDKNSFVAVVEAFFAGGTFLDRQRGLNVTVPFKEMAFELVKERGELSKYAQVAGAVNTLAIKNGKLYGDNTDGRGLVADLLSKGISLGEKLIQNVDKSTKNLPIYTNVGKHVVILGAGGATRGAILPLLQAGASISIFNRTLEKAEKLVEIFSPFMTHPNQFLYAEQLTSKNFTGVCDIIINATSAGTTGQLLGLDSGDMVVMEVAYDMMYGKETEFLQHFQGFKDVRCFDGLGMLIHQGALSFELWTGQKVDLTDFRF